MQQIEESPKKSVNYYFRFLLKDSLFYGTLSVLIRFLAIFTMPVFTRIFSKADYGSLDTLSVLSGLFSVAVVLGLDSALVRFFCDCESDEERARVVSSVLFFAASAAFLLSAALYLGAGLFTVKLLDLHRYAGCFRLMVLNLPFALVVLVCLNVMKITFARRPFAVVSLGSSVAVVAIAILLVLRFDAGVSGIFIAQLACNATFAVVGLYCCRRFLTWPSFKVIAPLLSFGLPVMLTLLASALLPVMDRWFVTRYFGLEVMGVYAVASRIAMLLKMPVTAFQMAWGPLSLSIYKNEDAAEVYNKVVFYYTLALSLCVYALTVFARQISVVLASSKYAGAEFIVLPLVFGIFFESVGQLAGIGVDLSKKTYLNLLGYGAGLVVGGATIVILKKPYGVLGVAYGIMACQATRAVALIAIARAVYPMKLALRVPVAMVAAAFVLAQTLVAVTGFSPVPHVAAGLAVIAAALVAAYVWLIPADDRNYLDRKLLLLLGRGRQPL